MKKIISIIVIVGMIFIIGTTNVKEVKATKEPNCGYIAACLPDGGVCFLWDCSWWFGYEPL